MVGFGTRKKTRVGSMRHRAWLERKLVPEAEEDQYDDRGGAVYTWEKVYPDRVPLNIRRLRGGELERARQLQANATHEIEMRYLPGVERTQRFDLDSRYLYIGDINNVDEANRFLLIICEEQIK